jgi:hypothetical protein
MIKKGDKVRLRPHITKRHLELAHITYVNHFLDEELVVSDIYALDTPCRPRYSMKEAHKIWCMVKGKSGYRNEVPLDYVELADPFRRALAKHKTDKGESRV